MDMPQIDFREETHCLHVSGDLTFATVTPLLNESRRLFVAAKEKLDIDLDAVTHADSAGLALLLEWKRMASSYGTDIRFHNLSRQLHAITSASNLDGLLL